MPDSYTTTKKHFEAFVKEAKAWINRFGLLQWDVRFDHEEGDTDRASCYFEYTSKLCVISLYSDWDIEPTPENLKKNAFHEVCELLLADISLMVRGRVGFTVDDIEATEHTIIRTLENAVFKPMT